MKHKSFSALNCSVAQALEILGERWTLLIIRDAFLGVHRFQDFLKTGISRNVLAERLASLCEHEILVKVPVDGKSADYRLTQKGKDLLPVVISLMHWGDTYLPHPAGERLIMKDKETGQTIAPMAVRTQDGRVLAAGDLKPSFGPGLLADA